MSEEALAPKFDIHVNLEGLTWGDMQLLLGYDGRLSPALVDLLEHIVVGGVKSLPFLASVQDVMGAVQKALSEGANPSGAGTPAGN